MSAKRPLIPENLDHLPTEPEDILEAFLDHLADIGIDPYPAQEEAILELIEGNNVILGTPTGSGKSLVAAAMHFRGLCLGRRSVYTCPIKALVNEKFLDLCRQFGAQHVGMMTGDATVNREAPILCCTAEILSNLALREGRNAEVHDVIMDEFHYYSEPERGVAWQIPLLTLPQCRFLLISATLGETDFFATEVERLTGTPCRTVASGDRPVPLTYHYEEESLTETVAKFATHPVYVVHFSQRAAAETAADLLSTNFCSKEEKRAISEAIAGERFASPYGKEIRKLIRHGIGLHHAGILPKHRLLIEKLAQGGLLKVICGTDTLGVGINVPIRTVLFTQLFKYDGQSTAHLKARDFHQIAGRAGRKGHDDEGNVVSIPPAHVIDNLKLERKAAANPNKKKKLVKKKPPEKGFVGWDEKTFRKMSIAPPEPLKSSFSLNHGTLLNVLAREQEDGVAAMREILRDCHEPLNEKRALRRRAFQLARALLEKGILEIPPSGSLPNGRRVQVNIDLQDEFSLDQTLSVYLIEALDLLDQEDPAYALNLLTFVEAILENPRAILMKQADKEKTRIINEKKAEGVSYEERMEAIIDVEHPKPNAEQIYASFNDFADHHPWVGNENIRPKSIAREMMADFISFPAYIQSYGLLRSEGVLLRYLTQVYKTLRNTVPDSFKTEEVREVELYFDSMIRETDSSLLDEWENLQGISQTDSEDTQAAEAPSNPPPPRDITTDRAAFRTRTHNACVHLVRALATGQWGEATVMLDPDFDPDRAHETAWPEHKLNALLDPLYGEHEEGIDTHSPESRAKHHLLIEETDEHWELRQTLLSEGEATRYALRLKIDLARCREENRVALELLELTEI